MLKAHGNFLLPDNVPANEFLNLEGEKISTSRNWAVWVDEYVKDFPDQQDVLRYVLCANAPETKDNDFTWKDFQDRNNSELVAIFGNFVYRTFVLMHKLCKGKIPPLHVDILEDADNNIFEAVLNTKNKIESLIEQYKFRDALFEVIDLARKGNKYLQDKQPWIVARQTDETGNLTATAQQAVDNTLHICLQLTANLAIFINPFLPFTAKKMLHMMKVVDKMLDWENAGKTKLLSVGYSLRAPELLFRKIEDEEVKKQVEKLQVASSTSQNKNINSQNMDEGNKTEETSKVSPMGREPVPTLRDLEGALKSQIIYDDCAKLDLRIGTILSAEKVEKADKLLKLEVDMGFAPGATFAEKRIIVSGIALHFKPEDIIGKQVVVVANLAPRKMRGIESNGMILMAEDKAGKLYFISPDQKITDGSSVT